MLCGRGHQQTATSSPGLFPQKMGGAPHPFFEGKALGTRLQQTVEITQDAIEDNKVDLFLVKFSVLTYYTLRRERG